MLSIVYWILLVLCAIGAFVPSANPWIPRINGVIIIILFAILGLKVLPVAL